MPIADSPGDYHFTIYAGATFSRNFTISPTVNLTGGAFRWMGRDAVDGTAVVFSWGTAEISNGGTASTFRVNLTAAQTAAYGSAAQNLPRHVVHDLEFESGGGEVTRLIAGLCDIIPEVTR